MQAVYSLSKHATSVAQITESIELLFIDFVNKVSNGYKFQVQKIIFIVATVLAISLNIDSIKLFNGITKNTLTANVVKTLKEEHDKPLPDFTTNILSKLGSDAYPLGWPDQSFTHSFTSILTKLAGWLITIVFTCFCAQFLYSRYIVTAKPKPGK